MKTLNSFILNYRGVREEMGDTVGDWDINKCNQRNMPLT